MCRGCTSGHQSLYDNSFAVKGPKLWNSVPYHLNSIEEFATFKTKLTTLAIAFIHTEILDSGQSTCPRLYDSKLQLPVTVSLAYGCQWACTLGWSTI